jgi:hypothetical protein
MIERENHLGRLRGHSGPAGYRGEYSIDRPHVYIAMPLRFEVGCLTVISLNSLKSHRLPPTRNEQAKENADAELNYHTYTQTSCCIEISSRSIRYPELGCSVLLLLLLEKERIIACPENNTTTSLAASFGISRPYSKKL